jgi:hypothetical protein
MAPDIPIDGFFSDWTGKRVSECVVADASDTVSSVRWAAPGYLADRINPFSPSACLASFFSSNTFSPSNQPLVVREHDVQRAKAVCALLNSALFFAYFFMLKEESTGRYINVRAYDLHEMLLYPEEETVSPLARVFDKFAHRRFPPLREQFDEQFDFHYRAYMDRKRGQATLFGRSWL